MWRGSAGRRRVGGWQGFMWAVPRCGTALRHWSDPGGCATRPAASDMLAIPLPKARGKPGPACLPATPTQAPRQPPTRLFCPAGATPRSRARGTPQAGRKGLGGLPAGRRVGAEERSVEVGARSAHRQLTCGSCLSGAAYGPRSEFSRTTSARAPEGSPASSGTPHMKPSRMSAQTPAPRCNAKTLGLTPRTMRSA